MDAVPAHLVYGVSDPAANKSLAETIIKKHKGKLEREPDSEVHRTVVAICSEEGFIQDPTVHLINAMMKRGVGMAAYSDHARAFIISKIPHFIDRVSSPAYLRSFAAKRYEDRQNKDEILAVFDKSLASNMFKAVLTQAVGHVASFPRTENRYYHAEHDLRTAFLIFGEAASLQEYFIPEKACQEKASRVDK